MEEPVKDQTPAVVSGTAGKSKLRYPLRSALKSKEANTKPSAAELSNPSSSRRGRPASTVSKSVGVLELSGKERSAKPPRRLSIPAKSAATPAPRSAMTITPISEARVKRTPNGPGKSDTPLSDASRSSSRRKFSAISSASYWLSQIKLSESASKHSISLGFFKLALEAGCEPLQKMRDELRSYVRRYNLGELGEFVKVLFESYSISENLEQLQASETCSQVPEEGTRSSDDEVHSSSSTVGTEKLRPKLLNSDSPQVSSVKASENKESSTKNPAARTRSSLNKYSVNTKSVSDAGGPKTQKKIQRPKKPEPNAGKDKARKQGKKSSTEEGSLSSPTAAAETVDGNKENMDASLTEVGVTEGI